MKEEFERIRSFMLTMAAINLAFMAYALYAGIIFLAILFTVKVIFWLAFFYATQTPS